jgi:hypothetical protein
MFKHLQFVLIAAMMLFPVVVAAEEPPIPMLEQWQQQMVQFGATHCQTIQSSSTPGNVKLDAVYYDGERVYYQIADYTNDSKWLACAQAAESVYRDGYLAPNNYQAAGWMVFPHGLWKDYLRTQDGTSRDALIALSQNAAFSQDWFALGELSDPALSREVAYNLQSKILAHELGVSNEAGMHRLAQESFNHMDSWFVSKSAPYIRPFMVALTSEALIMYYNKTGDSRVLPTLQMAWDYLWNCCWLPGGLNSFMYTDRPHPTGGQEPAPDLNMLIAPVFGWLYNQTGATKWRDRGDQIFMGGVQNAYLYQGKQFNQNYRYSFDYIAYRNKTGSPFSTLGSTIPAAPSAPASSPGGISLQQPSSDTSSGSTSSGSTGTSTTPAVQLSPEQATAAAQTWISQNPKPAGGMFRGFAWSNDAFNYLTSLGYTAEQAKQALRPLLADQGVQF